MYFSCSLPLHPSKERGEHDPIGQSGFAVHLSQEQNKQEGFCSSVGKQKLKADPLTREPDTNG